MISSLCVFHTSSRLLFVHPETGAMSSSEPEKTRAGKKVKIFSYVVGNTHDSHKKFLKKLRKSGAKVVLEQAKSSAVIVFCPIVSRFTTDVESALSGISGNPKIILVAMHHTYDPNYTLPDHRNVDNCHVVKVVECLFFEKKGLLKCSRNKRAVKLVCEQLGLRNKILTFKGKDKAV
ncbi:unnamed protein product [Menidia menidia]|uniref:(Atlantic silverside) hypothetical protein n=1 Tax=Menidia menidia TaxID=238744 RepID=A0A8S4AVG1_9TELE|nr:unnamed protein product [Menidia menidia]